MRLDVQSQHARPSVSEVKLDCTSAEKLIDVDDGAQTLSKRFFVSELSGSLQTEGYLQEIKVMHSTAQLIKKGKLVELSQSDCWLHVSLHGVWKLYISVQMIS